MNNSTVIVPAILTNDKASFQAQLTQINAFSHRVQIDVTDGEFATAPTLSLDDLWWPEGWAVDLHLMAVQPSLYLDKVIAMRPSLCILHAEAGEDLLPLFERLKLAGIRAGVALMMRTYPGAVKPYVEAADHVLIFAGQLGVQGSKADLLQMEKVPLIRAIKAEVEIGWDGGANLESIRALAHKGVNVINVGSGLSRVANPAEVYAEMVAEIDKNGVVL